MTHHPNLSYNSRPSDPIARSRKCQKECQKLVLHFDVKQGLGQQLALDMANFKADIDFLKQDRNLDGEIDKTELRIASSLLSRASRLGSHKGNGILTLLELLADAIDAIVTESQRNRRIAEIQTKMRNAYRKYKRETRSIERKISAVVSIRKSLGCTNSCTQGL